MVRVIAKRYFSTKAFKDKDLLPTLFSTHGKLDHLPIIIIAFIFSFKKKNELFCLILSDTKHMLSPFNIETTFRRTKFYKAYILQSDQHVRHASTPFVRKKTKTNKKCSQNYSFLKLLFFLASTSKI